jgi:hypothetical protein
VELVLTSNVYFTVVDSLGRISWIPKGGGSSPVYFTSRGEGTVVRLPKPE